MRQRQRMRQRKTERERERETDRERERAVERRRNRDTMRQIKRKNKTYKKIKWQIKKGEKERIIERERQTDRQRERERERDKKRKLETERHIYIYIYNFYGERGAWFRYAEREADRKPCPRNPCRCHRCNSASLLAPLHVLPWVWTTPPEQQSVMRINPWAQFCYSESTLLIQN